MAGMEVVTVDVAMEGWTLRSGGEVNVMEKEECRKDNQGKKTEKKKNKKQKRKNMKEEEKHSHLVSLQVDYCFVCYFDTCKLRRSVGANAAHGDDGQAVRSIVIIDWLMGSTLVEAEKRRQRVSLLE